MTVIQIGIHSMIFIAGLAQIALALGSLAIPGILKWKTELAKVQPLIKQMFWTYAAYILVINLCFGLISVFASRDLTNASNLATVLTGFIAAYWISRVLIQFFYFDRTNFPKGNWNMLAEMVLVALFVFLSIVYGRAFYINFTHIQS